MHAERVDFLRDQLQQAISKTKYTKPSYTDILWWVDGIQCATKMAQ